MRFSNVGSLLWISLIGLSERKLFSLSESMRHGLEPTLLLATIASQALHGTLAVRDNARWLSHLLPVASAHGSLVLSESRSATTNLEELESAGQALLSHSTRQFSRLESGDLKYFQEYSVVLQRESSGSGYSYCYDNLLIGRNIPVIVGLAYLDEPLVCSPAE